MGRARYSHVGRRSAVGRVTPGVEAAGNHSIRRLFGASLLQIMVRILAMFSGMVAASLVARQLGPADFGAFSTALALVLVAWALQDSGTTNTAVREFAADPSQRPAVLMALFSARLFAAVLLTAIVVPLGYLLFPADTWMRLVPMLAGLGLYALQVHIHTASAALRPGIATSATSAQAAGWLVAAGLLSTSSFGLLAAGLGYMLSVAAGALTARILSIRAGLPAPGIDLRSGLALYRRSLALGVAGLFSVLYYRADMLLVFALAGATPAAYYAAAYRVFDALHVLPITLMGLLLPILSRAAEVGDSGRAQRILDLGLRLMLGASIGAATLIVSGSDVIVTTIFGDPYAAAGRLLRLLALAFVPLTTAWVLTSALIAMGQGSKYVWITPPVAIVSLSANVVLVPRYGAQAAAVNTLLTETCVAIAVAFLLARYTSLSLPRGVFVSAAVMAAISTGLAVGLQQLPAVAQLVALSLLIPGALHVSGLVQPQHVRLLMSDAPARR